MRTLVAAVGASVRQARALLPFPRWAFLLCFAGFAMFSTLAAREAMQAATRDALRGDQLNLAIMSAKLADPELFPRDHTFGRAELFAYYTPSFLRLTAWLTSITGDAAIGWAILLGPLLFVYLTGMFLLLAALTRHWLVAAALAVLSARPHLSTPLEVWGMADLDYVLPRSFALACIPFVLFVALVELERRGDDRRAFWPVVVGFLIGAITNLHPGTGLHAAALAFPLMLLTLFRSGHGWLRLALAGIALLAGAAPMLLTYLGGTGGLSGGVEGSWDEFLSIVTTRLRGYVHPFTGLPVPHDTLRGMVRLFLAVQGAGLALGGLGLLLGRRWPRLVAVGARVMFVGLALSLLPLGAVIVERGSAQPLLWGWVAFALAVPLAGRPTRIDWLILALLALVIAEVFWITPTLQWVWQKYEVAALTSFAVEHARLSRFAYLALYLAAARLSGVVVAKLPGRSLFRRGLRWLLPLGVAVAVAWPLATVRTRLLGRKPWPHDPAATELYAWARTQTPKDALFFHPDLAFRYYARRSITHAWKDLSAAIYTRGRLFAEWRRFREYENASWDLNVLVAVSRRDQIDFIVRTVDKPGPPLPEVFRNAKYIVYRVDR